MNVLDASVILKWFVNEVDSDRALKLREEFFAGERDRCPGLVTYNLKIIYDTGVAKIWTDQLTFINC